MRLLLSLILTLMMTSSMATAQGSPDGISPEKKALILKFIEVFGTRNALNQNLDMIIKQIPPEQASEATQMREKIKVDEIIDQLLPVYDRNFTSEELQGLINFYDSPLGHALVQKIPVLMKESVEISSKYMESKFPESAAAPEPAAKPQP